MNLVHQASIDGPTLTSASGPTLVAKRTYAAAMVGNSSSGIIESPSFQVPTVNICTRQEGRVRARNVIDVGYRREEILAGIERAISEDFRASLTSLVNPYASPKQCAAQILCQS